MEDALVAGRVKESEIECNEWLFCDGMCVCVCVGAEETPFAEFPLRTIC